MQELPPGRTLAAGVPVAADPLPAPAAPSRTAGAILPHGALLVCDPVTLRLRFHSRNLAGLTKFPGDPFPGMAVFDLLGRQTVHDLRNAAAAGGRGGAGLLTGVRLPWSDTLFDLRMHSHAGAALIELEPSAGGPAAADRALELARQLVRRLAAAAGSPQLPATGARLVQAMLGFDRVMVCRRQPDGSACVLAEARLPQLDSRIGRILPAAELPDPAGPLHAIPDTACPPVPLDPPLAPGEAPADLSQAQLRSGGACADQPGVRAVLSIPLSCGAGPWGLILCHHSRPRALPPALRAAAELFAQCFALQIAAAEQEEAARRRAVINEELNHRIKNMLSLVKSIALQTGAGASGVAEYSALLEGRLHALARAHDQSLDGGGGTLGGLIEAEAVPHRSGAAPGRVAVAGPEVVLGARAYGAMALVTHEMMTNAVKYGALSVPGGRLAVNWTCDAAAGLEIRWCESGGPAAAPPQRSGFGSRLIRSSLEHDLHGTAELAFAPAGLTARFTIPPQHVPVPEGPGGGERPGDVPRSDALRREAGAGETLASALRPASFPDALCCEAEAGELPAPVPLSGLPPGAARAEEPLDAVPGQMSSGPPSSPTRAVDPGAPLRGCAVLVVEDQGLIALDTGDTLRRLGAGEVRLAASGAEALDLLRGFRPDLSVLDVNLGGETSQAVAEALLRRRCPFIFMTGYSDRILLPPGLHGIPVVRKPAGPAAIAQNLAAARAAMRDR